MATSDEYIFRVKCSVDDEIAGIKSLFANAQATADKNTIKVRVTGDEAELKKELEKLTSLNPSVLAKVVLDVDSGNLKETSDFLSKVIGKQMRQSNEIGKAFKDQITSGIDDKQIRDLLSSTLKKAFGDSTKITSGNISALYENLKNEAKELNAAMLQGMDTEKAFSRITELAKKFEILQSAFKNQDAAGFTKTLSPKNLDFNVEELNATIGKLYNEIGTYIGNNTQKLNDDITAAYTKVKDNLLQNLIQMFSSGGKVMLDTLSIGGAEEQIRQNNAQIEKVKNAMADEVQKAQDEINQILKKGYTVSDKTSGRLAQAYANYEVYTGKKFTGLTAEQEEISNAILEGAGKREKYIEIAKQQYEKQNNQLKTIAINNQYWENYIATQRGEIGTEVTSQMNAVNSGKVSGNSINVEINPVISDPVAFIAKIEEQLVNQTVKVVIEPTIKSIAQFEQLLQQQLPNEFINVALKLDGKSAEVPATPAIANPAEFAQKVQDIISGYPTGINVDPIINDITAFQEKIRSQVGMVPIAVDPRIDPTSKENLKEAASLDFSKVSTDLESLKTKVAGFKDEIATLQESAKATLTTISSLLEQFSAQPTSDSGKITSVIESLKTLSGTVNQDIDVEKTGHFVQALNEIGKLQVNPNVDLSNFKLGKLNSYLEKSEQLVHLGAALESLATGLDSLNIALTGANFEALKGVSISDKTIENLPKFAVGITQLKDELDKFSSSATGVLSSISQIVSKAQSLEYLYKLATAPNSNAQSNIIGNGLMSAFDKSAISSIQHPAGSTDEVAALAKEYQWLTSQARTYFTLASKYAKGTISSEDSLKLTQLERAMTGAIQRMAQFQETDQSLVTAQTDLQNALNKCGTAVESGLVNNLTKALTQIDTAENKALGFSNSIQEVKDKVVEIQKVFSTGGLIPTSEIEKAEGTLKKALSDVKQLKQDISEAKKAQENEIKNSYKNIFGNYGNTALGKADKGVVTDEVEIQKLVNEYNYLNKALSEYIQLMGKEAANPDKSADRTAKIAALTNAYTDFIARADAGVDTESRLAKASGDLSNALTNAVKTLSSDLHKKLQSYIDKLGKAEDGTTKYSETIRKLQEVQQKLTAFQNTKATNVSQIKAIFDEYQVGADVYSEALAKIKTAQKEVLESQKAQLSLNIEKWLQDNTKAAAKYETELRQLQKDIQKVSTAEELDEIRTKVLKFEESAEKAKLTGSAFADTLKQKFKELGTYLMSFASFYQVVNVLKQGISIAHEYDDAFTEMRKVTDASTSSLKKFQKESFQLANQVGTTAEQLQQSTADWLRLGESFDEAKKSAQDANILLNVSEFENIGSATESLVAMSQAYQDLDKMDIVDKLNNVG